MTVVVRVSRLPHGVGLALPQAQTEDSAGLDIQAAVPGDAPLRMELLARALVPTGIALQLPKGYEAQVRPRSGLALRNGVTVLNAPGTIDADYRGELQVLLVNLGREPFVVTRGMRIAQLVVAPVVRAELVEVAQLDASERAGRGFGSTGR